MPKSKRSYSSSASATSFSVEDGVPVVDGYKLKYRAAPLIVKEDWDEKLKKLECSCAVGSLRVVRCPANQKPGIVVKIYGFGTSDYTAKVHGRNAFEKREGMKFMKFLVRVDLEAKIPDGVELDLGVLYGEIYVQGDYTRVKAAALSGSLSFNLRADMLAARSLAGKIDFKGSAKTGIDLNSVAGEIAAHWTGAIPCVQITCPASRVRRLGPMDPSAEPLLICTSPKGTVEVRVDRRYVVACAPSPEPPPPDLFSQRMPSSSSTSSASPTPETSSSKKRTAKDVIDDLKSWRRKRGKVVEDEEEVE